MEASTARAPQCRAGGNSVEQTDTELAMHARGSSRGENYSGRGGVSGGRSRPVCHN